MTVFEMKTLVELKHKIVLMVIFKLLTFILIWKLMQGYGHMVFSACIVGFV